MGSKLGSTLAPEKAVSSGQSIAVPSRYIRLGPFQVDQRRQEVTKNGVPLKLKGKVYQALLAFIEKRGEVITREEIRALLWPDGTQGNYDENVNVTVNKLRQALGDSYQPLYIETIPRKGYYLMLSAEFADSPLPLPPTNDAGLSRGVNGAKTGAAPVKPRFWITFGVVALILTGMLVGGIVTKLWILHVGGN